MPTVRVLIVGLQLHGALIVGLLLVVGKYRPTVGALVVGLILLL